MLRSKEMEYTQHVKVPKDRVAVIIGQKGKGKQELEERMGVALSIDSKEGDVRIASSDTLRLYVAQEVVRAIARGFNPDIALGLQKTEYMLELLNITEYAKSKNQLARLKGRVIGEGGKSRETIEQLSETNIVIYGKTIGIIGPSDCVQVAKKGIDMLLTGAPHATVFRILERWRRERRRKDLQG